MTAAHAGEAGSISNCYKHRPIVTELVSGIRAPLPDDLLDLLRRRCRVVGTQAPTVTQRLSAPACATQSIDKDHSGTITVDELKVGLREQGSTVTEAELADLVRSLDADNSGTIDYEARGWL